MIDISKYKSGHYEKGTDYKFFVPTLINDEWAWNAPEINHLLEKAAIRLGELNAFARLVPDTTLFIRLHQVREAVDSSRIEGTRTNMDEALLPPEEINPERREDWKEVDNYTRAMSLAIAELEKLPLSSRLLKKTHAILMDSVRGEHKQPGHFRRSQNWIGGHSLADAFYIPPHDKYVQDLMGDLENFLHNRQIRVPALVKIAIAHYQFETIHPFLDGNGRIGRLLITLYLVSEGILEKPLLYLSSFFEKKKSLYYDNLTRVRTNNDMQQWIKYFLVGVEKTAGEAVRKLSQLLQLKEAMENEIKQSFGKRGNNALTLLHALFYQPVLDVEKAAVLCNCSFKTANTLMRQFEEKEWLREMTGQNRNRLFEFEPYLKIFGK